ncbi:hydroxyacid dehydrogenase [Agromyces soli]
MSAARPRIAFAMTEDVYRRIFTPESLEAFARVAEPAGLVTEFDSAEARAVLAETEILVSGWGCPVLDEAALEAAPRLRAVVHAAGSVKHHLTPAVWQRGIEVSSAAAANAVPVAEYTVAMIVLAGKRVLPIARHYRLEREAFDVEAAFPGLGNYGTRVGIVGASKIGREVVERLRGFDLEVVVYDPYLDDAEATALGVASVGLDELLATSDIVSVHAPSLPETQGMIGERAIALLKPGATLINTARGELIDQEALTARVLRGDLYAVLDVTTPWVLAPGHPLYDHENVLLTPHIAGSLGVELGRLAEVALDETARLAQGLPLAHPVRAEELAFTA